jgi:type II secretory pathway pseudopilin PulG
MCDPRLVSVLAKQAGFTLVEVVMTGALVGILCLLVVTALQMISKQSAISALNGTRNMLSVNLRKRAGDLDWLRASLHQPENAALLACVCGTGGGCENGQSNPMSLYAPGDAPPKASLNYFDKNGSPCNATDANCVLQTQIAFVAQCPPPLPAVDPAPPATCAAAEVIAVSYTIQSNPGAASLGPPLSVIKGAAYTQVAAIAPSGSGVCP